MGWADCGTDDHGRKIGYAFIAKCDHKGCRHKINRGLSYVCGDMHGGGEVGCGQYFCQEHRQGWIPESDGHLAQVCEECEVIWRKENPEAAAAFDEE